MGPQILSRRDCGSARIRALLRRVPVSRQLLFRQPLIAQWSDTDVRPSRAQDPPRNAEHQERTTGQIHRSFHLDLPCAAMLATTVPVKGVNRQGAKRSRLRGERRICAGRYDSGGASAGAARVLRPVFRHRWFASALRASGGSGDRGGREPSAATCQPQQRECDQCRPGHEDRPLTHGDTVREQRLFLWQKCAVTENSVHARGVRGYGLAGEA